MSNLAGFVVKRLLAAVLVTWLIATIVFFLAHATPYDPIALVLGNKRLQDPQAYLAIRHQFGLDLPLWQQYTRYLTDLLHGNLGYSEQADTFGQPVWNLLRGGVPVSIRLGAYALILSLIVGIPVGLLSALRQNTVFDHGSQTVVMIAWAVPAFVIAPLCQLLFGVVLGWLPVAGWGDQGILGFKEQIMPVTIFAAGLAGFFAKSFRSFMLEILRQDYIRTARAKGLKHRVVIYLHACKNTLVPLASIVGPTIAFLVVGSFIIENFFNIPGIGSITVNAVIVSDFPVIETTTILLAVAVVVVNMFTDIFYAMVDPRVRI